MNTYEFTLKFCLPDTSANPDDYIERLGAAGCEDALIGIGQNARIALNFTRESDSAYAALFSALADVKHAIPDAQLIEATPDLVGLTDVADLLGFTRQYMRKLMLGNAASFPAPIHEGRAAIWHLAKVLTWLKARKMYPVEDTLIDIAKATMQINIVKETISVEPLHQEEIRALIA